MMMTLMLVIALVLLATKYTSLVTGLAEVTGAG